MGNDGGELGGSCKQEMMVTSWEGVGALDITSIAMLLCLVSSTGWFHIQVFRQTATKAWHDDRDSLSL